MWSFFQLSASCDYVYHEEAVLNFVIILFPEGKKDDVESGPEEEEVPTRGFLKRQANMIVDAKSRSKRGSRRR